MMSRTLLARLSASVSISACDTCHMMLDSSTLKLVIKILIALGLFILFFRWFEHAQVFIPSRTLSIGPESLGRPCENLMLTTVDGVKVNAWFWPALPESPRAQWVFLFCHGNAGNLGHRLDHFQILLETQASLMAFDYRGYGQSRGRPSEAGVVADAQAACQWLRQKGFATNHIILLGESLGGAVAADLATREPVGGVILQSSFTSIPDLGRELFPWLPVRWLGRIKFDTKNKLPLLKVPIMVMHSRSDTLVRFHHAEINLARAHNPKMLWELTGDHNDAVFDKREHYRKGLEVFLQLVASHQPGKAAIE